MYSMYCFSYITFSSSFLRLGVSQFLNPYNTEFVCKKDINTMATILSNNISTNHCRGKSVCLSFLIYCYGKTRTIDLVSWDLYGLLLSEYK